MSARDYRDDVIEALAASEAALREDTRLLHEAFAETVQRALQAEAERDAALLVATTWAHQGRAQYIEAQSLRAQLDRLRDEYRALRVSLLTDARAA